MADANDNVRENETRQELLRHLEKEAFQLANYYFVFQGVIFTAIYVAPSDLKCHYRWFPITLSALAGSINFYAIMRIAWKYKSTLDDADRRHLMPEDGVEPIVVWCERYCRAFYCIVCACIFLAFLLVTVVTCNFISCPKKSSSAPAPAHT